MPHVKKYMRKENKGEWNVEKKWQILLMTQHFFFFNKCKRLLSNGYDISKETRIYLILYYNKEFKVINIHYSPYLLMLV